METYKRKNKHFNDPDHAHELTFSCYHHWPLLTKDRPKQWFCNAVNEASKKLNYSIWAYVIMPDHVHLLIFPNEEKYSVSQFLKRVKQSVSRKSKSWLELNDKLWFEKLTIVKNDGKKEFRFWQAGGGYDRNIKKDSTLWKAIEYIHANPVRRDLVDDILKWKWSSALDYEDRVDGPIVVDKVVP